MDCFCFDWKSWRARQDVKGPGMGTLKICWPPCCPVSSETVSTLHWLRGGMWRSPSGLASSIWCTPLGVLGDKVFEEADPFSRTPEKPPWSVPVLLKRWFTGVATVMPYFFPGNRIHLLWRGPSFLFWEQKTLLKVSQTADRRLLASGSLSFLWAGLVSVGGCAKLPSLCVFLDFERHTNEMVSYVLLRNNLSSPCLWPDGWTLRDAGALQGGCWQYFLGAPQATLS